MSLENKVEFKTVYKTEQTFGYDEKALKEPHGKMFYDDSSFNDLVSQLNLPFSFKDKPFESEKVVHFDKKYDPDFTKEMVVAVFQGQRPSSGHSIEITDVVEKEDKVIVYSNVNEWSGMAACVMTDPCHFVACKKINKPIEFVWNVKDHYKEQVENCNDYMISSGIDYHDKIINQIPEKASRAERNEIIKKESAMFKQKLDNDFEEVGVKIDGYLELMSTAFARLTPEQVEVLQKKGYQVFKSV